MPINAIAIGGGLYYCLRCAAYVSGGCLNPAVGLIQVPFQAIYDSKIFVNVQPNITLKYWPIYIFAPFLGGAAAGLFSRFVHEKAIFKPVQEELPKQKGV